MVKLLITICNGSADEKLKLMLLHGMVQIKKIFELHTREEREGFQLQGQC